MILGVTLIALILLVVWRGPGWKAQAQTGAAYGARMGCSCHFIEGRSTDSCTADFEPGMGLVSIKADDEEKSMTAHVPLLASRTARFRPGWGCLLDPVS